MCTVCIAVEIISVQTGLVHPFDLKLFILRVILETN